MNSCNINQPPLPPIPSLTHPTKKKNECNNSTSIKQHFSSKNNNKYHFDMRRVKKIRRLDRKIRSISLGTSKEFQREISKIEREKQLKLCQLSEALASELNDSRTLSGRISQQILRDMNDKKKTLQSHCIRELQRIKTRIINNYKSNEKPLFKIRSISSERIRISIERKYSLSDINCDILSVFNNWRNEISFNTKRTTRAATKNKKYNYACTHYASTDLSRIRFHLREDEIKYDLRILFNASEQQQQQLQQQQQQCNTSEGELEDDNNNNNNCNYNHLNISNITNKLGPLNDPIYGPRISSRSRRVARVNYSSFTNNHSDDISSSNNNYNMYHSQEVHFYQNGNKSPNNKYYTNNDGNIIQIPNEEIGHNVIINNFNINHGEIIRLNYLGNNITIDAYVVSIKKNQLSAVTLVGKKRKRIWYKELRIGKINIAPATAYR